MLSRRQSVGSGAEVDVPVRLPSRLTGFGPREPHRASVYVQRTSASKSSSSSGSVPCVLAAPASIAGTWEQKRRRTQSI